MIISIIAIIAVVDLIIVITLQQYMLFKAHQYFMVAKNPQAYVEVMKNASDRELERAEKKKAQINEAKHKRFKDIIKSGEVTDDEIREFNA